MRVPSMWLMASPRNCRSGSTQLSHTDGTVNVSLGANRTVALQTTLTSQANGAPRGSPRVVATPTAKLNYNVVRLNNNVV